LTPTSIEETLCQMPEVRATVVVTDDEADRWIAVVVPWEGARARRPRIDLREQEAKELG
jgi:hypothetical protein